MPSTSKLKNLGPRSLAQLAAIGISSEAQLRASGSVAAFPALQRAGLNMLWALEGALSGRRWQEVAQQDHLSLLEHLAQTTP